jgi:hypothetical protein
MAKGVASRITYLAAPRRTVNNASIVRLFIRSRTHTCVSSPHPSQTKLPSYDRA